MKRLTIRRLMFFAVLLTIHSTAWLSPANDVAISPATGDALGNRWSILPLSISQNGNNPVYSDIAGLFIDSTQPAASAQGTTDPSGEIIFDAMPGNGYSMTRRVRVFENSTIRVVDIVTFNDRRAHNFWYGTHLQMQPRNVETLSASNGLTGCIVEDVTGKAVVEVWGDANAAASSKVDAHGANNGIIASLASGAAVLPGDVPVVIVHLHATAANVQAARALVSSLNAEEILKDLPAEIRNRAINFVHPGRNLALPDLLEGDAQDIVELRSGQRLRGTIAEESLKIIGVAGALELRVSDIDAITTSKEADWHRAVLTNSGDILCGRLDLLALHFKKDDGSIATIPTGEITRIGVHGQHATQHATTQPIESAWFSTAGGDQIAIEPLAGSVEVHTVCGPLKIDAAAISEVQCRGTGASVHRVVLSDGSHLSGVLSASSIALKPLHIGKEPLAMPLSALSVLHLRDETATQRTKPVLKLVGGDEVIAGLNGDIQLDTSFDTITLHANELTSLNPSSGSQAMVSATMSDGVTVRGRLAIVAIDCRSLAGLSIHVPALLLAGYEQPHPNPNAAIIAQVKELLPKLAVDDWKERDRAEHSLTALGPVITELLRSVRSEQPPEAQQRIDGILANLESQSKH